MLQRLTQFLDLVLFRSIAELAAERERTYLGFAWWIIAPGIFLATLALVFGGIFARNYRGFVLYLLIGLTWWQWFTSCLSHGAPSVLGSIRVLSQVRVPPILFPFVTVMTDTYKFLFVLVLLLLILWASGVTPTASWLSIPVLLLSNLLYIVALTTLVAAVVPLVPDARFAIDSILHMLMFLSGVFFYREQLPEALRWILDYNPIYRAITNWREALTGGQFPDPGLLGLDLLLGGALLWAGVKVIDFLSDRYAKSPQ